MANKHETKTPVKEKQNKPRKNFMGFYGVRVDSVDPKPKVCYALPKFEEYSNHSKGYSLSQSQGGKRKPTVKTNGDGED